MSTKGIPCSEETKAKIRLSMLGKQNSLGYRFTLEQRKNNGLGHLNKRFTELHKHRISLALRGNNNGRGTAGNQFSERHKANLSAALKGKRNSLGYRHTEESKRKMEQAKMGNQHALGYRWTEKRVADWSGINNPSWEGGISFEPYGLAFNKELKALVRKRDNFTCQLCSAIETDKRHSPHHIDYDKGHNTEDNLITLCVACNAKVNFNRSYWQEYFTALVRKDEVSEKIYLQD